MRLNFSNSNRWKHCSASVEPSHRPTTFDPEVAAEGIAAAWVAERVLFGDADSVAEFEGECAPNGVDIDWSMLNAIDVYTKELLSQMCFATDYGVEASAHYAGATGRIDAWFRDRKCLTIVELKYGYRRVEIEDNWQLLLAACAKWKSEQFVRLLIYSPRANPSEPWQSLVIPASEMQRIKQRIHARITEIDMGDRTATAGKHCTRCPHAADCTTLGAWIEERMNTTDLKELLDLERVLKTRITSIEADYEARISAGEYIPGWCMEPRTGDRRFKYDAMTVEMMTGTKATKVVARSPNEMEKEGVPRSTIDSLTYRPFSGHRLKPWSNNATSKLFGGVK